MADGDHSLPSNEELFEQPGFVPPHQHEQVVMDAAANQQQQNYELAEQDNIAAQTNQPQQPQQQHMYQVQGHREDPQASGIVPMHYQEQEMMAPHEVYYPPEVEENQIPQPPPNGVFQPVAFQDVPQPREGGEGDVVDLSQFDANEHTVWIDSDGDEDEEDEILKANFFLPYSDHNYDCADPADRVIHPQEGPFPIIEGLDEEGNVIRQYMPEGCEHLGEEIGKPTERELREREEDAQAELEQQQQLAAQQHQQPMLVQQVAPQYQNAQHPQIVQQQVQPQRRPVNPVVPFPIGGHQADYAEPQRMQQRGPMAVREQQLYRTHPEYGTPMLSSATQPRGVSVQHNNNRGVPQAVLVRTGRQEIYQQSPQHIRGHQQPHAQRVAALNSQQGSYQHVMSPTPAGGLRRVTPMQQALPGRTPGATTGILTGMRPIGRPTPQQRQQPQQIVDMQEREFVDHPLPIPQQHGPPIRRQQDMAPHRMTPEQRQEQQANRQRGAQFPLTQRGAGDRIGVRPTGIPPTATVPAQGTVIGRRMGVSGSEDLMRSPQRVPQPVLEQQRRFQVKVTDTYSTPIPKASDQLPAQLTEDPDEPSTSGPPPPKEPEVASEQEVAATEPEAAKAPIKSPSRLASATSSPVKPLGGQKATTLPHRMTQEERNAHIAKATVDKEKPAPSSSTPSSSSAHPHHHVPPPLPPIRTHHPDDTLSVVQSVFDNTKPREPDTPKDKEEISKIANELKFSADKFSGNQQQRQRTISGGRPGAPQYHQMQQHQPPHMQHPHHQQQHPIDMMADGRKRHPSGGRYDLNLAGGQAPHNPVPPHFRNQRPEPEQRTLHPEDAIEPQNRPRGRPRGSTGAHRSRFPSGHEPVAPHRAAGGARTLPPRQPPPTQQSSRNGGPPQNNSDSESEGIEGDGDAEESWEMRCHCGMDHGDGDTIECEGCKTWQHWACMGLNKHSDTTKYKCEICVPRKLSITKADAIRMQKKILEKLIKAGKEDKKREKEKRKSEPVEQAKKQVQQSQSRKSAPMAMQPAPPVPAVHHTPQLNEYSRMAAHLLSSLQQTTGADTLLEDSRRHKKAKRMFVMENVEALVTTEVVSIRQVILEVNGYVSMASEVKRQPGGGNCLFMYDGLMKGTSGEDTGDHQELVCIDAKKKGNDSRFTRRSCLPNCVLKHVLGTQATLGIMIVATKDIHRNVEVTLPFDADWRQSDVVLECAEHITQLHLCPFENERRRYAIERNRTQDVERRKAEEDRRADEERRRLEEEVRRERAAKTRQMDLEAEAERLAQEKAKKAERDEARKKKEAEKKEAERKEAEEKAKREAEEKILADQKAEEKRKAKEAKEAELKKKRKAEEDEKKKAEEEKKAAEQAKAKEDPPISSREARKVKNYEEAFRHIEEEEKRKEERRSKSLTPADDSQPSTSGTANTAATRMSRRISSRRDSQASEASEASDQAPQPTIRAGKRMQSVATPSFATPASKRVRSQTVVSKTATPEEPATRKRSAVSTTKAPEAKRAKREGSDENLSYLAIAQEVCVRLIETGLEQNKQGPRHYKCSAESVKNIEISGWVATMPNTGIQDMVEQERMEKAAEIRRRKMAEVDKKLAKAKAVVAENEKQQKKAEKQKKDEPSTSSAPKAPKTPVVPKEDAPKKAASQEEAPKKAAPQEEAPKIDAPVEVKPKTPRTPAPTPKETPKEAPKASASTPKAAPPTPKSDAPVPKVAKEAPAQPSKTAQPSTDFHGMEREASLSTEGSVEKELAPAAATTTEDKKITKKISMAEYALRKKQEKQEKQEPSSSAASSSGTPSSSAPARRGFIPSTEGSGLANVQLSDIPLGDRLSTSTTTTAPSGAPGTTVTSPSTRSTRARGAPSESNSADEAPVAHTLSLRDRISDVFGIIPPHQQQAAPVADAIPPPPPLGQRVRKPTRWADS